MDDAVRWKKQTGSYVDFILSAIGDESRVLSRKMSIKTDTIYRKFRDSSFMRMLDKRDGQILLDSESNKSSQSWDTSTVI